MSERLPWFRCKPAALLGALAGLGPDEGYVYTVILLRIYETGGPIAETARTLHRRTGLPERRVAAAIDALLSAGKVQLFDDGRLDSSSTHDEIAWQGRSREAQSKAGKTSAEKRAKKDEQSQRSAPTRVERPLNHIEEDKEEETPSLRSGVRASRGTRLPDGWQPSEEGRAFAFEALGRDWPAELARFADYWRAQPGQKGVKTDWEATWRNWCRRAAEHRPRAPPGPRAPVVKRNAFAQLQEALERGERSDQAGDLFTGDTADGRRPRSHPGDPFGSGEGPIIDLQPERD